MPPSQIDPELPRCLVYRDRLLPIAEHNFFKNQYCNFQHLKPIYVGRHWENPPSFLEHSHFIGKRGPLGFFKRLIFKQTGRGADSIIQKEKPSIIHAQFITSGVLMMPLVKRYDIPLVVSCYDADVFKASHQGKYVKKTSLGSPFSKLVKLASCFVATSPAIAACLNELGVPDEKIALIPIGVPDQGTVSPGKNPCLLVGGKFVEKRGYQILFDALAQLGKHGVEPQIIIAGEEAHKRKLEKQIKQRELKGISICGFLQKEQLKKAFSQASAVLIPSVITADGEREGWPMLAKAAMMAGLPIIASDKAAIPTDNLVDAGGMEIPSDDPDALAMAIADLLYDGAAYLPSRRAHARAYAITHLEDTVLSARLENLLLDVAEHHELQKEAHGSK